MSETHKGEAHIDTIRHFADGYMASTGYHIKKRTRIQEEIP
jgi:hypothetical protein